MGTGLVNLISSCPTLPSFVSDFGFSLQEKGPEMADAESVHHSHGRGDVTAQAQGQVYYVIARPGRVKLFSSSRQRPVAPAPAWAANQRPVPRSRDPAGPITSLLAAWHRMSSGSRALPGLVLGLPQELEFTSPPLPGPGIPDNFHSILSLPSRTADSSSQGLTPSTSKIQHRNISFKFR